MLPLDSDPKLAVGQWTAWWSGFYGGSSSKEKLCILSNHSCDIYDLEENIGWGDFEVIKWGASQ